MTRSRILILGGTGQVGRELIDALPPLGEVIAAVRADANLEIASDVAALVQRVRPDVIVNAAAYTAVDRAESEPERCARVNVAAVGELAEAAAEVGALFVHYSTDYVFDGRKRSPYDEADVPNPLNVYGASKLAGELAIADVGGPHVILRTSWVYGPHGANFMRSMLRLARQKDELRVVSDQVGAPTSSRAIAHATREIVASVLDEPNPSISGTYHLTAGGETNWCEFARAILEADPRRDEQQCRRVVPITTAEYPTAAERPRYSVLDNAKVQRTFGMRMRPWKEELDRVMAEIAAAPPLSP